MNQEILNEAWEYDEERTITINKEGIPLPKKRSFLSSKETKQFLVLLVILSLCNLINQHFRRASRRI
jgi:hypothetical protein